MAKKYECCMIYENKPGNPARDKIEELRSRKTVKSIYPEKKKPIGRTPQDVLENSKKYAIFLSESDNFNGNAFHKDIEGAATFTKADSAKEILYTILDGDRDADIVQDVEIMLDDVPDKQVRYLREYDPQKMEKFILKKAPKGTAKAIMIGLVAVLLSISCCNLENYVGFIHAMLVGISSVWNSIADLFESQNVIPYISSTPSVIPVVTGTITAVPIPIIWLILLHRENVSEKPLFWLNLRRFIILLLLLFLPAVHKSATLNENVAITEEMVVNFGRPAVIDLHGYTEEILVPLNGVMEPSGEFKIEECGNEIFITEFDKSVQKHLKDCPPLNEGHYYQASWNSDIANSGHMNFNYHPGEAVIVKIEAKPDLTDFQRVSKAQLRQMAEYCGIEFSNEFVMYSADEFGKLRMDIADISESDGVFSVDIGVVCFRLKDRDSESTIIFELGPDDYTELKNHSIPSGHAAVTLEFGD